ncbi:thiol:disulfide interchange protein, partial [Cereibacter changlensis JA139]
MIALGPFVLSAERFSAGLGILAFLIAVAVLTRLAGRGPERRATQAVVLGVIAARLAFVLANLRVFLEDPLSVLYLWQGGYLSLVGVVVAALWLGRKLRRMPDQLGAFAIALILGAASWNTVRLLAPEPGASQLPTQTLATLDGGP